MTRREYFIYILLENKTKLILDYITPCSLINCPSILTNCDRCIIEWLEDDNNRFKLINKLKNNETPSVFMSMYKSFCKEDNFEEDVNCKYCLEDWLNENISYERKE